MIPVVVMLSTLAACSLVHDATRPAPPPSMADDAALFDVAPPAVAAGPARPGLACVAHPLIDAWEDRLRSNDAFWTSTLDGLARSGPYLDRFRAIVEEEGVPGSLALLPVIESSFRARALAPDGGRGLWQLQARTARRFGLVIARRRDDRLDPELATRAAARYLHLLHERYQDWLLALAAYNAGEGRVDRALDRRPGVTFWQLVEEGALPRISCDYVPRFLAIVRLVEALSVCG